MIFLHEFSTNWGYILISLIVMSVLGENEICKRNEVVTKTKAEQVQLTRKEPYTDHYCRYSYRGGYESCTRWRNVYYTATILKQITAIEAKEFCCPGYREGECSGTKCPRCDPVCDFKCLHGVCTRPNHCECDPGYAKREHTENICDPVCSETCVNGYCSLPEFCSCSKGYENDPTSHYICRPVCSNSCINANCTAPDTCTCFLGYKKITEGSQECHPQCKKPCHNAVCSKPDVCSCLLGYKKESDDANYCSPICSKNCVNGMCTGPDECTCFDGFRLNGSVHNCEPICSSCVNAFCSAPEICTCNSGFEKDPENGSVCIPVCSPECVNGKCIAPGSCECLSGFEESDDLSVCKPFCSEGCENGVCTEPEVCTCLWGFHAEGNFSNCSISTNVSHECVFTNQLLGHAFNKSCFKISGQLSLETLTDCKILKELVIKHVQNQSDISLILSCNRVSVLRILEHYMSLDLFCDVQLIDEDYFRGTTELETRISYFENSGSSSNNFDLFTTEIAFESSMSTLFTDSETEYSTESYDISNGFTDTTMSSSEFHTEKESLEEATIQIIFEKNPKDLSNDLLLSLPLSLNIKAMFTSLIERRQLTENYFDFENISLVGDWCLCHRDDIWWICADSEIQLYLCPCQPTSTGSKVTESSPPHILRGLLIGALSVLVVVLLVLYGIKTLKYSGSYSTLTRKGILKTPRLSLQSLSSQGNDNNS